MSDTTTRSPHIYCFGAGRIDGSEAQRHLVGGKGASLAEMTRAELNVPPGFTISAECCDLYYRSDRRWPPGLDDEVRAALAWLEGVAGRTFGVGGDPLLVAVRSGAAQSMPGMMDTVLNVGLNPECVRAMAERTRNPRGAWEAYAHFLAMFGRTVCGVPEPTLDHLLHDSGKRAIAELDVAELESLCGRFRDACCRQSGREFPATPWQMLVASVNAVFASWNSERAVTYRRHHPVDGLLGTAVTVQMMCPSEVSGVMFTANPVNPALEQMVIESSYGLGEAVVLGKVTPDRFVLDRRQMQITERVISVKDVIVTTLARDGVGQVGARDQASLTDAQVHELAQLGLRVEAYFRKPCDVEWALSGGRFYLLQARPIKARAAPAAEAERERVRREEMTALAQRAAPTGTVWARFNLAEVLPDPTPMTWAIVRRLMSGEGGYGLTYRDLGFEPHPSLGTDGVYDLICGRPYCNLSREPLLYARGQPLEHDFAALKAAPHRAVAYPQAKPNWSRAGWTYWLLQPWHLFKSLRFELGLQGVSKTFADRFRGTIVPAFLSEVEQEKSRDLTTLDTAMLLERLEHWVRRTLCDFARDSLKPTVLAAAAMGRLEWLLVRSLGPERARAALGELVMGVHPDPEADVAGAVRELAAGRLDRTAFLTTFGHRGSHEMELARPRWNEDHTALDHFVTGADVPPPAAEVDVSAQWKRIAAEAKLPEWQANALGPELHAARTYLALREAGKNHLMKGYALIRRILVELDRRHSLDGGIFFLTPDDLPRLAKGEDVSDLIVERRRRREIALSLEVPQVLFSDDLDAIGRHVESAAAETLRGVPVSAGIAEAPALVLTEPPDEVPEGPFILVCPSTDPAWVPLFVRAKGLVMETGGVLSHGAIVAREFGLPAVAGIPDVHRRLRTGQRLRLDGGNGTVTVSTEHARSR